MFPNFCLRRILPKVAGVALDTEQANKWAESHKYLGFSFGNAIVVEIL